MRYPASEKLEIIWLVEQSHLPARRTLDRLGVPRTTFYRWYDKFLSDGVDGLERPELSPRELAVRFTDTKSYFVSETSVYRLLKAHGMDHVRGAPYHPQTQGKIERWHQTLKNKILLENYFLPGDLKANIGRFVEHYNHHRDHENRSNLTPADVYFGRGEAILRQRERIKRNTINQRRLQHSKQAA